MTRRTKQLFSLSLLDLLTSALGAVIFLFIITPKGGESATKVRQAMVYFDSTQMKIHGTLPDSLLQKSAGDTLLTVLVAYKELPKPPKPAERILAARVEPPKPRPQPVPAPTSKPSTINASPKVQPPKKEEVKPKEPPKPKPPTPSSSQKPRPAPPVFKGDAPSVPCRVSFEVNWLDRNDNVDLFVCKGGDCVYGGRKRNKRIGNWDSGKSRNRLFGNDLRTNQEAVRQFDNIIPGEYKMYAQFKSSKKKRSTIMLNGLLYTKDDANQQRGESFRKKLTVGKGRTLLATVILKKDGSYVLKK
ncbi:MAG: hypothetical protein AAF990_04955 [Bacteroidota bacterium]